MATKVRITGVIGPTGELQQAGVWNPDKTLNNTFALTEEPPASGQFNGEATLTLANGLTDPYEVEVRKVTVQTTAGFNASTTMRLSRGTLGWVKTNVLLRTDPYLDAAVSGITGGGGGGGAQGPGPDLCTIVIKKDGVVMPEADVWVSNDASGHVVIAGTLETNAQGEVALLLAAGSTYYLWATAPNMNPIVGRAFIAVAD